MHHIRILIGLCYFLGFSALQAQDFLLQLYVIDEVSNAPLSFVNVQIEPGGQGGTTDEAGKLNLRLPEGQMTIRATFLGYEDLEKVIFLDRDIKLDLVLIPSGENLTTVVVTDADARELIERPQMGVERLSATEIESIPLVLGEVDILKGLQLRSGVSSAGEVSNGLSVRGGTIDQNLTLLDGAPIFTPTHLFGLFSVFTPEAIGGVDLYRANVPARYGGRIASVIDVRSKTPSSDQLKIRGSIGLVSSSISVETPISRDKRWKVIAAGRIGLNDFLFSLVERLKRTKSRFGDATLKLRYSASEKSIFTLSSFYSNDFYQVELINTFNNINSPVNQFKYTTFNGSLEWLKIINDRSNWRTRVVSSDYRPSLIFPEEESPAEVSFNAQVRQLSLSQELRHQAGNHQFSGGIEGVFYRIAPGELDPDGSVSVNELTLPEERALELGIFAEDQWDVSDKLTLSLGLRFSQYAQLGPGEIRSYIPGAERSASTLLSTADFAASEVIQSYNGLEPRIGINYKLGESSSFKAAYAISRQYLQNIYNATTPLPTSRWKVSDSNIKPQRATLYSSGLYTLTNQGKYRWSLEAYYRKSDNILEYKPGADFFLEPQVETQLLQGEGEAWGLEVGVEKTTGRLKGQLNYTYARTFNQVAGPTFSSTINEGLRYPGYFDQPHTLNANLVLDQGRTHELGFNFVVQSNRPYTVPNGFLEFNGQPIPLFLERNNARLPLYHRLDFSWTIHNFKREKRRWVADWVFTIYNVYGRDNANNIYFAPKNTSNGFINGLFSNSPLGAFQLSIFSAPVFSLSYKFTFQ